MARVFNGSSWAEADFGRSHQEHIAVPGLVDVHCHGVAGMDVMQGAAREIGAHLRSLGVEWYCPTTVTADWQQIRAALAPCAEGFEGFAGVHIEGPFISPDAIGAQPREAIQSPSIEGFQTGLGGLAQVVRIVTLAPELPGAFELMGHYPQIQWSAGHTRATYNELRAAREHGLGYMTHFFNAMSALHHREPGAIGYGLSTDIQCEIICDGTHVADAAIELAWRCKGPDKLIGVSDGTMLSGTPEGTRANMWGHSVENRSGSARLADGTLAGSSSTQVDVLKNAWRILGPEAAIAMCSLNPRSRMGLPEPRLWLLVDAECTVEEVVAR